MNRLIFTRRRRSAILNALGALALLAGLLGLMLAYFDVLIK
jgi:hypothetical protein